MATVQTIATTLTADARPAASVLRSFEGEVDKTFSKLDARTKRFYSSLSQPAAGGIGGAGGGGRNGALGLLEGSRLVEDFSAGFGNNGLVGGIRAATNNLSQMAFLLQGPVAGAIAGFAAAGLGIAAPYIEGFFRAKEAAKDFGLEIEQLNSRVQKSQRLIEESVGFDQLVRGTDSSRSATSEIEKRLNDIERLNAKVDDLNRLRAPLMEQARQPAFGEESIRQRDFAAEQDKKLFLEQLDLLRERGRREEELNKLIEKRNELQSKEAEIQQQKNQQDFAGIIRGFQRDDLRQMMGDNNRVAQLLEGSLRGLGGNVDPLAGMENVPPGLRELLGAVDAQKTQRTGGLANVATANSQTLLRLQAQAKEAAEARAQRDRLIRRVEELLTATRDRQQELQNLDDVNLN